MILITWMPKQNSIFYSIIKGIFSDSNNFFLLHESEDINKKSLLQKFQLIPILRLQVMRDYVYWHCSIDYTCVKLSLVDETLCKNCSHFIRKWFQPNSFRGNVLIKEELQFDAINSIFKDFENALYTKSVSMLYATKLLSSFCFEKLVNNNDTVFSWSITLCKLEFDENQHCHENPYKKLTFSTLVNIQTMFFLLIIFSSSLLQYFGTKSRSAVLTL